MNRSDDIESLTQLRAFSQLCGAWSIYPLPLHSRVHYFKLAGHEVLLKRDDELSFSIPGSKLRKFSSLLGHLLNEPNVYVIVQGSELSNSVAGLVQLLREVQLPFHCILKKSSDERQTGNALLRHLLLEEMDITWVKNADQAHQELSKLEGKLARHYSVFNVPEGADCFAAIPGAMTAAYDLPLEKLKTLKHIFVDAGTGVAAIGLLLGLALREVRWITVHIITIAGDENSFREKLTSYQVQLEHQLGVKVSIDTPLVFHSPPFAKSFGATNASVFQMIKRLALHNGLLTDPIYTAKYFAACELWLSTAKGLAGEEVLLWHSGGGHSLHGFSHKLLS